jgi:hypothetical protein
MSKIKSTIQNLIEKNKVANNEDLKLSFVFFTKEPSAMVFINDRYTSNVQDRDLSHEVMEHYNKEWKNKYNVNFVEQCKIEFYLDKNMVLNLNFYKEGLLLTR